MSNSAWKSPKRAVERANFEDAGTSEDHERLPEHYRKKDTSSSGNGKRRRDLHVANLKSTPKYKSNRGDGTRENDSPEGDSDPGQEFETATENDGKDYISGSRSHSHHSKSQKKTEHKKSKRGETESGKKRGRGQSEKDKPEPKNRALEELFRVPIFESESQPSFLEDYSDDQSETKKQNENIKRSQSDKGLFYENPSEKTATEYREQMVNLLQGKQGLAWARKIFFLSTEMIFPGFLRSADAQSRVGYYMGVRVRSSCFLQLLLYADAFFFVFWFISLISTLDITTSVLKELHGYLFICLAILFSIINVARTRFGFWGNENDEVQYLALYWMTTAIVELPLLGFLVFTDIFSPVLLPYIVTMDSIMLLFIIVESIVGFHHFNNLLRDEIKIIRMARRTESLLRNRAATAHLRPKITNTVRGPNVKWVTKGLTDAEIQSSSEDSDRSYENNMAAVVAAARGGHTTEEFPEAKKIVTGTNNFFADYEDHRDDVEPLHRVNTDAEDSSSMSNYDKDQVDIPPPKEIRRKNI